jgi:hypothetical protein
MIIEYMLEPTSEVVFESSLGIPEKFQLDGADIYFDLDENNTLKTIWVSFSGLPMKWEREDLIDPHYPETRDPAFRVIKYLTDRIQLQVKQNAFNISNFDNIKCEVLPETEEEKHNYKKFRKRIQKALVMNYSILGAVDTKDYELKYAHAQAYSNFTEAMNANNPNTKYERLYKVIETFFTSKAGVLDTEISMFMQKFDKGFMPEDFQQLRDIRNRCIHPQHRKGHIASNDLELLNDLAIHTKELEKIAELLLDEK